VSILKITGTRGYIDIEHNGRTARFSGELCIDGFAAIASTMKWLPPNDKLTVTETDCISLMKAVIEELKDNENKVFFTNDRYEDIDFSKL
jgi:hypothetical protein